MILGTEAIKAALADGAIVCDPMPERIEGAHIDVRLGAHYWEFDAALDGAIDPDAAIYLADDDPGTYFVECAHSGRIWIPARGFVLAHTQEYIGTAPGSGLLSTLHTRSTLARWGLGCHPSAGWGDESFASRWTLEIINPHPVAIAIPVGARVGCIAFHRIDGTASPYQPGTRYNARPGEWSPEMMLPRKGNW